MCSRSSSPSPSVSPLLLSQSYHSSPTPAPRAPLLSRIISHRHKCFLLFMKPHCGRAPVDLNSSPTGPWLQLISQPVVGFLFTPCIQMRLVSRLYLNMILNVITFAPGVNVSPVSSLRSDHCVQLMSHPPQSRTGSKSNKQKQKDRRS